MTQEAEAAVARVREAIMREIEEQDGFIADSEPLARAAIAAYEATLRPAVQSLEAELAEVRSTVVAFAAPWAVNYAKDMDLAPGELHPAHYDILEKCGARMDSFRRAILRPVTPE